jgi:DNA-binding CsgD family transcriptional regulator
MGTHGVTRLTDAERRRMRSLVRKGISTVEIARIVGRALSTVHRATRGMKRKRVNPNRLRDEEQQHIRELYCKGITFAEIARMVGRGESSVVRATRGMKRRKPQPRNRKAKRNDKILKLVQQGMRREQVGKRFGISARQVSSVVAEHPLVRALLQRRRVRVAAVARRFRMELSTARRIAAGKSAKQIPRSWNPELRE